MPHQTRVKLTATDPIKELELTVRAYNCLKREGIDTVGQLLALSPARVRGIRNVGQGSMNDIVAALAQHGLTLKGGAR